MKIRRIPITLDLQNRGNPVVVPAKQGDSGRVLVFQICNGGERMIITGTPQLAVKKKSGKRILNNCTVEEGNVVVALTNQTLAEDGRQAAELRFTGEDGEIKTFIFWLDVEKTVYDPDAIESTNEFSVLDKWVQETIKETQEAAEKAVDAAKRAEDAANGIVIIPEIGSNGNWYLGDKDTGKPSHGKNGITPDIQIGDVVTLGPDEKATASITGNIERPMLNLGIPQGKPGSGGGSISNNYEDLNNKPRIAGVEVSGNKSLKDYGIQPKGNYLESIPEEYVTETELSDKGFLTSEDIPNFLPNPHKLIFTGAVTEEYDGTEEKTINIPQGSGGVQNGIPSGGTTGQVLTKRSNSNYDAEWRNPPSGGGGDAVDIDQIRKRTYLIEIPDTKELTIADNREEILQTVKDGKYKYINIPDGIKHWNAQESKYDYPKLLTMEYIRNSEFYANMWLPNEMNCHQDLRYKVNTNGTIKYDNVNEKADLTAILQWGILMLGENKEYPTETIHFIVSNFKTLGFNSQTRSWELIHDAYPTGAVFNIEGTVADEDTIDIPGVDLKNGFYSFEISQEKWHNKDGDPMCFHFFPKVGIFADTLRKYENLIVAFRISIQESKYDNTFVVMAGGDAYGSSTMEEMFYSRFQTVRAYSKLISVTSVLESESYKYVFSNFPIFFLIYKSDGGSGEPGDGYSELPYLVLDGHCHFDTGIVPNIETNFEIKCNPTNFEIGGSYVCGIHDGTYKYGLSGTDNWYAVRGTASSAAKPHVYYSQDWIIKQNGTNVLFNDDPVILDSASELSFSGSFFVGNMNNGSGGAKSENGLKGKLYYLKLYTGEESVMDLIPVKKSDGTICLYDKVKKKYLLNRGSGMVTE